ncbi:metal ABC transporter solute-binding protein, Zn/Mn family [Magnetospirillum aberrantis]|uniref:High-affinity zinc uptake system protein ZnuA n=1 Tax=Magnetospirillum aberrantis SpK TaxID=908842 RepID=A0A7C9V1M7_9PROT|nr:zinc ABC transporter substrate-binding protein [Magnetospirillum aberrantis]NFV81771.1 zinc ABC transporter solute-binding protein [Magnetospirillum aberrantis SpK]
MTSFARTMLAAASAMLLLFSAAPSHAGQARVVVSVPPLHSLVSNLLRGVDTPELLMRERVADHLIALDSTQVEALRRADMVVWAGPELEGAIAEAGLIMPDLAVRSLTLGRHIPIMTPVQDGTDQPGNARDLRFWLDPRLVHHAVHVLAPALVRLYPEASETILDNEIALMAEIHQTEHNVRAALGTAQGTPLHLTNADLLYLEWRFNLPVSGCARGAFDPLGFNLTSGPALYGKLMEGARDTLAACMNSKPAETARHGDGHVL